MEANLGKVAFQSCVIACFFNKRLRQVNLKTETDPASFIKLFNRYGCIHPVSSQAFVTIWYLIYSFGSISC